MAVAETPERDDRRSFLKKAGTFAAVTPPAVTFLLSTSMSSKAIAASGGGGPKGNNGAGNGEDPPPPGNPPVNDGPGTGPRHPVNAGARIWPDREHGTRVGRRNNIGYGPQGHGNANGGNRPAK